MDRNFVPFDVIRPAIVALRKESVDRNTGTLDPQKYDRTVALRKESVDRNVVGDVMGKALAESLSARRAWIEMPIACGPILAYKSLSARRAWIEMPGCVWLLNVGMVALRKESVDRN